MEDKEKLQEILHRLLPQEGKIYRTIVEAIERPLIELTLERTEGNQLKAARILGINRNTMRAKIKKLGIDAKRWKNSHETILFPKETGAL